MGLKVGDTLTVNLLGREITGRIANLRRIEWSRLGINFAIVFAPGTLEAAPQTHLAAVYAPPAEAERIAAAGHRAVSERLRDPGARGAGGGGAGSSSGSATRSAPSPR